LELDPKKKQGILKPKELNRSPRKIDNDLLINYIKERPDAYLREITETFNVDAFSIFYACKRLKITLKKRRPDTRSEMKKRERLSSKK
jgi:transposase